MKYKYPLGAELNEKGREIYGEAVPDGIIPVLSPTPGPCFLEGLGMIQIYLVNIPLFYERDKDGYHRSLQVLAEKFKVPAQYLDVESRKNGMPLRVELVSCVQIDPRFVS